MGIAREWASYREHLADIAVLGRRVGELYRRTARGVVGDEAKGSEGRPVVLRLAALGGGLLRLVGGGGGRDPEKPARWSRRRRLWEGESEEGGGDGSCGHGVGGEGGGSGEEKRLLSGNLATTYF